MTNAEKKYFEHLEQKGQLPKADDQPDASTSGAEFDHHEEPEDKLFALDEDGDSYVEHFADGGLVGDSPMAHLLNALKKKRG